MTAKLIDLTNKRVGAYVVLKRAGTSKHGQPQWLCKCRCGNRFVRDGHRIRLAKGDPERSCCPTCIAKHQLHVGYAKNGKVVTKIRGVGEDRQITVRCNCGREHEYTNSSVTKTFETPHCRECHSGSTPLTRKQWMTLADIQAMKQFARRERLVKKLRRDHVTLEEIAGALGVTRERVRQIELNGD